MRVLFLVAVAVLTAIPVPAQPKKRIAILDFDYATVQSSVAGIFGTNQDVGKGIADLLVAKLVTDGTYTVIERKAMDKVLAEQNFSNSDRANPLTAAKVGRLLGVEAIVIGSITQFGRDDKQTNVGGSVFGRTASKYGLGGVGAKNSKAAVGISARMVGTDTGEIFAVASGKGESTRSGASLVGSGGGVGGAAAGALDMRSTNFANTILGEAVGQAVNSLALQLNANSARLPTKTIEIDGLVADVTGDTVVLNVGAKAGVKVGDQLHAKRVGRTIKDPATGKVLRRVEEPLGTISITEVDDSSAVGKYSGGAPLKVGDSVRNQ
jgi:curli biogenesis system outer membrane secretion channel CsgG